MADDAQWAAEAPLAPEEVSERSFPTAFRGFDPVEVRAFLGRVADEVRRLHTVEAELRRLVEEAAERPPDAGAAALVDAAQSEATALVSAAQAEADAAVSAARSEADTMVREAKERVAALGTAATAEATRVLEEARAQAARIRASASDELRTRTEEAEGAAVRRIAEAEREAATIRVNARADADAVIEAARERGREMVGEAQAARERMLADLSRRKRAAQAHLEQMKTSRDRLLETLKVARRTIDDITMRFEAQEGGGAERVGTDRGSGPERSVERAPMVPAGESPSGPTRAPAPGAPARSRGVAIGEAPSSAGRPQIAAPQAQAVPQPQQPQQPPPAAAPPAGAGAQPAPSPPERETRTEERRSSALRILRRNRPPERPRDAPPHTVGRDSPAEGVRIIRGNGPEAPGEPPATAPPPAPTATAAAFAPEPEPQPAPAAAPDEVVEVVEVEVEGRAERAPAPEPVRDTEDPPAPAAEPAVQVDVAAEETAEFEAEELEPLAPQEIRPRIEDLFARLRADRQAAGTGQAQPAPPAPNGVREAATEKAGESPVSSSVVTADREEHLLQSRDRVIEPLTAQLTRRLKRALQDEQNTTLDRLRTSRGQAQLDGLLPATVEQAEPYRRLASSFLADAARAGTAASPFGPVPVDVADLAAELGEEVAGGLRARVRQVLTITAGDDTDLSTISDRISAVYREWKTQKVERLAVHFLLAAHERGRFVAYPEGTRLRWVVDDDGPCPDCDDNALAGGVARGQLFPTGQVHPPAHVGCRCLLTPAPT